MGDILRNWLQARLGILIDLTPEVFGHYTRDGTLLAQILHNYDVINSDQLETIVATQDPALCRVNLKLLRIWLRFVDIDFDDENIDEISCGKGTTSLRLFYKLYLCLETKDRLHLVTLQKERERFLPGSKKFEVTRVCEDPPPYQPPEHPLSFAKLAKGWDVVDCHRAKLAKFRRGREKLEARHVEQQPVVVDRCVPETAETLLRMKQEQSEELDRFARRHVVRRRKDEQEDESAEIEEKVERERRGERCDREREYASSEELKLKATGYDPEMARLYVEWLKDRRKRATTAAALKSNMQKALLAELWERMAARQERTFDEAIASRVLDQSRYEKQIVTKLCEVREQKNVMAENQKVVEDITLEAKELEHTANYERAQDSRNKRQKEIEIECARVCELKRKLRLAKIQKIREKHWTLCREVVDDLATIALNVADHRRVNDGHVPLTLLSEWKTLFLKSRPIFDEEIPFDASQQREESDLLLKSDVWMKIGSIDVLRDALFDDYLETKPPWDASLPEIGEELREIVRLGRLVIGHVAHRLLDALYAKPLDRSQILLSRFKNLAIVLGIEKSSVYELFRPVLDRSGIRTVRMEDAINHCLERYKQEMSDVRYIDLNIIAATTDVVRELENEKKRISRARFARLGKPADEESTSVSEETTGRRSKVKKKSIVPTKTGEEQGESNIRDKQTQTPRDIPYDDLDPVLTDTACIGKWTYEFLTLGEPITDDLATKILIEYLKSLVNAKGWVLIDYPNTYEQMSRLETALTSSTPPPESKERELDDITMEDIETLTPRIVFEDKSDPFALNRQSRLVPKPIARQRTGTATRTFATLFVRVKQQPKHLETDGRTYELLKDDAPSIDRFYASLKIARVFYYASFDSATLKKLVRLVMGDLLHRRPSEELFGDALSALERDAKRGVASPKAAVVRQLVTEDEINDNDVYTTEGEPKDLAFDDSQVELEPRQAKPGEPNWRWIDFPLPPALLENLARLWERLEETYIEESKELLFLKSVHSSSVAPYADFVKRNALDFVKRPDSKQDLLHRFHRAFNAIDEDARHDADVKCELHRRVADFQTVLWESCDRRRREAEDVRKRHVDDHWTAREAVVLFDTYVGIVQAEIDRCVDATRLLHDYYLGMAKRPLRETGVSKVILNRIGLETSNDTDDSERRSSKEQPSLNHSSIIPADRSIEIRKKRERARTRDKSSTTATFAATPPAAPDRESLRKEIDDLMIDRQKIVDVENVGLFRGILENVRYARSIVDASMAASIDSIKREQQTAAASENRDSAEGDSIVAKMGSRGQDLALEWRYAVTYEIERARQKLDSIENVARLDVGFLLTTLQRAFHGIYDAIVDRYWREMKSVNDMANVFCFAIEEGRMLEKELVLDGDRFVVRSNVYVTKIEAVEPRRVKEIASSLRFQVANLIRLMEIFKQVAPSGTMCERSLVYILQDLASHGQEEGEPMLLPCCWYELRLSDVSRVISRLFGSVDYVDWREFLVHAMDLPTPTLKEILAARHRFRTQDPDLREVVSLAQYHRTSLWFLDEFGEVSSPEEALRRMLTKELLCLMYMTDRRSVNYTALLLAFCKDENPRDGFAKALALALGNRVCADTEEGERYAKELLQRKRSAPPHEALEVAKTILKRLMRQIQRRIDRDSDEESSSEGTNAFKLCGESIPESVEAEAESSDSREYAWAESAPESDAEDHEVVIYWLHLDICITVLAAAVPWHVLNSEVIGKCKTFAERLASVYEELRDVDLNDERDVVLAHRLLNHEFITHLLNTVGKFTVKSLESIVGEILLERQDA